MPSVAVVRRAGRGGPAGGVGEHSLHVRVVIDRERLVAGAEVDDLPFAAAKGAA